MFHDRLINQEDKSYFCGILSEMSSKHFSQVRDACLSPSLSLPLSQMAMGWDVSTETHTHTHAHTHTQERMIVVCVSMDIGCVIYSDIYPAT